MTLRPRSLILLVVLLANSFTSAANAQAHNPIIWADVPDMAMIRVGDTYYMSSTTMHMSPGLPLMKSKDLVNWDLVGYAYDTLADNDALTLQNNQSAYGRGSWASSLRYHNGTFYVTTFSATSGRTHVYTSKDIENGPWTEHTFEPVLHDHSLFFDDDGKVYMVWGGGDIRIVELTADATAIKPEGVNQVIIANASAVAGKPIMLPAEGSQLLKVDGKYYLVNIVWPQDGMRTVLIHRADSITGPYEGRIALQDRGIAQGSLIDTPDGRWYAYLFQDSGAVGRIPYIVPVKWVDGWPVLGDEAGNAPATLDLADHNQGVASLVTSDEFDRPTLPLAWQWNHNPDNAHWSLEQRPGWLRLKTGSIEADLVHARNTLTQRTFGPVSSATTMIDVSRMRDGDRAGLSALQKHYGWVGVAMDGDEKSIVMVIEQDGAPNVLARIPLAQNEIHLRTHCDFRNLKDEATFAYSLDGEQWTPIGETLKMRYTLPHFMGYRFGLFNFATQETGGHVDFDHFHISGDVAAE